MTMKLTKAMQARAAAWQAYVDAVPAHWPISIHPVALANAHCVYCHGVGIDRGTARVRKIRPELCGCVYRQIFRICFRRYQLAEEDIRGTCMIEVGNGAPNCTRIDSEYCADFEGVAMRALPTPEMQDVFRYHFLAGGDWKFCVARMDVDKGRFFHLVYKVQELIGLRCATVQPHRLYPLDEYFGVTTAQLAQVSGGRATPRQILPDPVVLKVHIFPSMASRKSLGIGAAKRAA